MTNANNCHVHFELPANGDTPSNSLISNTGNRPPRFNFGFGSSHSPLTADLVPARRTIPQTFNFGFLVRKQVMAEALVPDLAHQTAVTPLQPQQFNFGFTVNEQSPAATDLNPPSPSPAPTRFNFGWTHSHSTDKPAAQRQSTRSPHHLPQLLQHLILAGLSPLPQRSRQVQAAQPFNFGMDVESHIQPALPSLQDVRRTRRSGSNTPNNGVPASVIPLKRPLSLPPPSTPPQAPAPEHTAKFNFGWKQPPSATAGVATHVGFDHHNKPFQFGCKVPPAKVGEWTPAPIMAAVPQAAPVPITITLPQVVPSPIIATVPEAAPAPESDPYTPKALPNWEGAFPTAKRWKLDSASQATHQDTIGCLIGDAEKAAIDIVKQLNGDEFDRLAQTMLGSLIRPGDDVRDPMPEEVLDSNCAVLSAFCESRDWLTRIFKDLITIHHASEHHIHQLSFMDSLTNEVEIAERTAGS
ncbi:uncharacterized protein F5147DRAFT_766952 [Suillus discolor]|uniref:Uncharacterized protein n=1 Tax=Suillus discolor TaxID=1912936 RepID=A0A9P7FL87_9AGAM|nr:uncharacterized protein F5147DRAFT_766952 [Suillus discolor]KAG2119463.1 hypothetical protein F5147DRAFT_766952 [Suillus discolor]